MNERIKEIAEQATKKFSRFGEQESWENLFAELIIKECIRVPYYMWDKAELNADIAVKIDHSIKDHFGVEQ